MFQRKDGKMISAAELRGQGGEVLRGPDGSEVLVLQTRKHKAEERRFITIETVSDKIEVTDDHRMLVQGLDGLPMNVLAGDIHVMKALTGSGFQLVKNTSACVKMSEVVEVTLQNDAPVLSWGRTSRRFHHPDEACAFAVRGGQTCETVATVGRTFWEIGSGATACSRSHSASSSLTRWQQRRLARSRRGEWAIYA